MTEFFAIITAFCLLAAYRERRDWLRCIGFLLFALLAGMFFATNFFVSSQI